MGAEGDVRAYWLEAGRWLGGFKDGDSNTLDVQRHDNKPQLLVNSETFHHRSVR